MKEAMNPEDPQAQMKEELAALSWLEDELQDKYDGMEDENYRAKIAIAEMSLANETTPGTARMLGDMRREMHALAAPFFQKVLKEQMADIRRQKVSLLAKMEGNS